jgi:CheY-like chemotaxis protein
MFHKKEKYTILLADDDYLNNLYYREILSTEEFEIIYVSNGRDAILECKDNIVIDLVLMDMRMPHIDGLRAIRKIRQFNKELPILIQSAYISGDDLKAIKSLDYVDYISKPIKEDEFFRKIYSLLSVNCKL